jgi:two-component system, chemotaxis family, response regulator Rcp1
MNETTVKVCRILIVEDNPGDVRLMREALRECGVRCHINDVGDGVQALAFLRRQPPFENAERPDLVFLDLNLPHKNGCQVLSEMKSDPHLRSIPVLVLSTSTAPQDIAAAYDRHANCYMVKPIEFEVFVDLIRQSTKFWFTMVQAPRQETS